MSRIHVPPLGRFALAADRFMEPIMRFFSGAEEEEPQRTHRWNNRRLTQAEVSLLHRDAMVYGGGDPQASSFNVLRFHLPRVGGWKKYVVVRPFSNRYRHWHVGWLAGHAYGVSRVPLDGPVRVLRGPGPTWWFGVDEKGNQLILQMIGEGEIGDKSAFGRMPLL